MLTMLLCFRELVSPVLDNLSRKLQYATRSKVITIYSLIYLDASELALVIGWKGPCAFVLD